MAVVLSQEPDGRTRFVSGARSIYSADEIKKHSSASRWGGANHTSRTRVLRELIRPRSRSRSRSCSRRATTVASGLALSATGELAGFPGAGTGTGTGTGTADARSLHRFRGHRRLRQKHAGEVARRAAWPRAHTAPADT